MNEGAARLARRLTARMSLRKATAELNSRLGTTYSMSTVRRWSAAVKRNGRVICAKRARAVRIARRAAVTTLVFEQPMLGMTNHSWEDARVVRREGETELKFRPKSGHPGLHYNGTREVRSVKSARAVVLQGFRRSAGRRAFSVRTAQRDRERCEPDVPCPPGKKSKYLIERWRVGVPRIGGAGVLVRGGRSG